MGYVTWGLRGYRCVQAITMQGGGGVQLKVQLENADETIQILRRRGINTDDLTMHLG